MLKVVDGRSVIASAFVVRGRDLSVWPYFTKFSIPTQIIVKNQTKDSTALGAKRY
jgi:hypothetical protein